MAATRMQFERLAAADPATEGVVSPLSNARTSRVLVGVRPQVPVPADDGPRSVIFLGPTYVGEENGQVDREGCDVGFRQHCLLS